MGPLSFTSIERRLLSLLQEGSLKLSASQRQEVADFLNVGEYGIALETLSALIVEEEKPLSHRVFSEMLELADEMGIRETVMTESLKTQFRSSRE